MKEKETAIVKSIINKLSMKNDATYDELLTLLLNIDDSTRPYLYEKALESRQKVYGNKVYLRGLLEFTNYCKRTCLYCGIQSTNSLVQRYRLSKQQILSCCEVGYALGYRTYVLQGGEDPYYTDEIMIDIIKSIKEKCPDCAVTLSIGEKSYESYKSFYDAGADRYLLRHETYNKELYNRLHPKMSFENRIQCLYDLKKIGYQVGSGFLVGLPSQTKEDFVADLLFLKKLEHHMVGIGPFIPHHDTPLANENPGTAEATCDLLAIIRLLLPLALIPASTALGSIDKTGRQQGLMAGANVIMPNLSPIDVREKYALYDGKLYTGNESVSCTNHIKEQIASAGFQVDMCRGDHPSYTKK